MNVDLEEFMGILFVKNFCELQIRSSGFQFFVLFCKLNCEQVYQVWNTRYRFVLFTADNIRGTEAVRPVGISTNTGHSVDPEVGLLL